MSAGDRLNALREAGPHTAANKSRSRWLAALIVALYSALGTLYALRTPKWQTPDEPAHYNYIQYVAQHGQFPVLEVGDYPAQYLEEIKAAHFPPQMPIASIRYESHQPPLYYVLAAIVYRLTAGLGFDLQFLALRLFSVLLGATLLVVVYRLVRDIFPHDEFLALVAMAFIAVLPMHLAMTAAINNDTLAELLLLLMIWQSVVAIRDGQSARRAVASGALLGLALLTKTTIYLPALGAVLLTALLGDARMTKAATTSAKSRFRYLLYVFVPALLLATPWFVRNALVYGGLDILGWQRHELVVAGQLRTAELLAQIGPLEFARKFMLTTFRSFWAQFGWMGVLVDERIYQALALLSAMLVAGLIAFIWRVRQGELQLSQAQSRSLALLGAAAVLTVCTYLGYNIGFVQHQGRYLFPALGPLGVGAALSLRELLRPHTARRLAVSSLVIGLLWLAYGILRADIPQWSLALLIAAAAFWASVGWLRPVGLPALSHLGLYAKGVNGADPVGARRCSRTEASRLAGLPTGWQWLPPVSLYVAFLALNLVCLFAYVVPYLR